MIKLTVFALFNVATAHFTPPQPRPNYNILTFDGGAIKGIITAQCVKHMEKFAYDYAVEKGYEFPRHSKNPETMHMTDLFDMISGTSIGSISASALSVPLPTNATAPKYYAQDLLNIMTGQANVLFQQSHVDYWKQILGYIFFVILFTTAFHFCGRHKYKNKKKMESQQTMLAFLRQRKEQVASQRQKKDVEGIQDGLLNHIQTQIQERKTSLNASEHESAVQLTNVADTEAQKDVKKLLGGFGSSDGFQRVAQESIMNKMKKAIKNTLLEDVKKQDLHADRLLHGKDIQRMILTNNEEQLDLAFHILHEDIRIYKHGHFKVWILTIVGFLVGLFIIAPLTMTLSQYLGLALYNRDGLDSLTKEFLGENRWDNILQDDLLVTTFDYNSMSPRFYSKYFTSTDPGNYNFPIRNAASASASAPVAFSPFIRKNEFNITEALIDGGVICNNPALYAFDIAYYLRDRRNIRVMSLGTGVSQSVIDDYGNTKPIDTQASQGSQLFNYMMNIEVANANRILASILGPKFVRLQTENEVSSIANSEYWFNILKGNGDNMWNKPLNLQQSAVDLQVAENAKQMLRDIIDERYGPQK